jgi:2-polyprenyl-6-methoxyphenol hydroxylase-like FAD-dependent oxidoreductase
LPPPAKGRIFGGIMNRIGSHAVVIGGSLTGLVASRALSPHFDRITLLERDKLPDGPEIRKGAPQAKHVHVLLKQGERILDEYFPGLVNEMLGEGVELCDMSGDTKWFYFGNWKKRFASGFPLMCQSRPYLEWKVRERARALGNVSFREEIDVRGYAVSADGKRVSGVRLVPKGSETEETLDADLVVDATGRGTRTPQWLESLGFGRPPETELEVDVGYASRVYKKPVDPKRDWKVLLVYPKFPESKLGVIVPAEGDRWIVTLVGWYGDHPGGDEESYLDFTRNLPVPDLYEAIRDAEPLSPIYLHKFPSNWRRHYERMPAFPDGLAVIGDASCSFNPTYGQGMTTGSIGAHALDECLRREGDGQGVPAGFSRRFQAHLAKLIDVPWLLTTSEDTRNPNVTGDRPFWMPLLQWYTARIHRLTWSDELVAKRFLQIMHLTERPTALFAPRILLRALTAGGGGSAPAPAPTLEPLPRTNA